MIVIRVVRQWAVARLGERIIMSPIIRVLDFKCASRKSSKVPLLTYLA